MLKTWAVDDDCVRRLAALARLPTVNRRAPAMRMSDLVCSPPLPLPAIPDTTSALAHTIRLASRNRVS
jgi:hypothetical protein